VLETSIKLPISQRWTEGPAFTANIREGKVEIDVSSAGAGHLSLAATA
jgi:hypothetical protein